MTETVANVTPYSSFNARALAPHIVAETFIPPPDFFRLANNCHTFVVGPRGSGKTTLLKMLQQPAIESWKHESADQLRASIAFTGVFIPTDVTFTESIAGVVNDLGNSTALVRAAYAIHVLRATIEAIEYRAGRIPLSADITPFNRVSMSREMEQEFVLQLSHTLRLTLRLPSLTALRAGLAMWMDDLFEFAECYRHTSTEEQTSALSKSGFLRLDITRTAANAIDAFESVCQLVPGRWALLFDELELAPPFLVESLTRRSRSTDPRFLFKLSLSPYSGDTTTRQSLDGKQFRPNKEATDEKSKTSPNMTDSLPSAQEAEDYDCIKLWYPHKLEGLPFCKQLATSVLASKGFSGLTVDDLLGKSEFDSPTAQESRLGIVYKPGSRHNKRMKRLAEVDGSFRKYLLDRHINLDEQIRDDAIRATTLRKINGLVIVREAYRNKAGRRGRKNPHLYTGATAFYTVSESNPRLIIGLLNQLLRDPLCTRDSGTTSDKIRVQPAKQSAVFSAATSRFRAYLRTIPCPPIPSKRGGTRGLLSVIDAIGKYFHEEVALENFDDDPDLTFIVDSDTSDELCSALQRAVNAGAIIWVPDKADGTFLSTLRGKRFRLSYLLAPHHGLPLQLGRAISLGRVLDPRHRSSASDGPFLFRTTE